MAKNNQKLTTVHINNLICDALVGTKQPERNVTQQIIINIQFTYDAAAAIRGDDLTQTIDYDTLTQQIIKHIERSNFFLLESLNDSIITLIMKENSVINTEVSISKPNAVESADSITVTRIASKI